MIPIQIKIFYHVTWESSKYVVVAHDKIDIDTMRNMLQEW